MSTRHFRTERSKNNMQEPKKKNNAQKYNEEKIPPKAIMTDPPRRNANYQGRSVERRLDVDNGTGSNF